MLDDASKCHWRDAAKRSAYFTGLTTLFYMTSRHVQGIRNHKSQSLRISNKAAKACCRYSWGLTGWNGRKPPKISVTFTDNPNFQPSTNRNTATPVCLMTSSIRHKFSHHSLSPRRPEFKSQFNPCGIRCVQSDTGRVFLRVAYFGGADGRIILK